MNIISRSAERAPMARADDIEKNAKANRARLATRGVFLPPSPGQLFNLYGRYSLTNVSRARGIYQTAVAIAEYRAASAKTSGPGAA